LEAAQRVAPDDVIGEFAALSRPDIRIGPNSRMMTARGYEQRREQITP
jgi:hypothetical protein